MVESKAFFAVEIFLISGDIRMEQKINSKFIGEMASILRVRLTLAGLNNARITEAGFYPVNRNWS